MWNKFNNLPTRLEQWFFRFPDDSRAGVYKCCALCKQNNGVDILSCYSLVSTYVVCERLSVMHEPAGVVENLVQNSTEYPYSAIQFQNTLSPQNENSQKSWHFDFSVAEYPPPMKILRNLGTLTFQLQNTPPQNPIYTLTFQLQNTPPNPNFQFFP